MKAGDIFFPTHGDPEGKGHADSFKIVGVLAPTGTPNDRATFVNMEGFYLMEGHAKPVENPPSDLVPGETATDAAKERIVSIHRTGVTRRLRRALPSRSRAPA